MTEKLTLVAIFAHPDDEAFGTAGTLTKYAHEGVDVHLVMATCGEAGKVINSNVSPVQPISLLREQELRQACEHYRLADLHMLGYMDGQTAIVPPAEPVYRLVRLLRQIKPQVVISFGPDGIYGHFDHIVVHRWAAAAVEMAADSEQWVQAGPPHTVAKFYYRTMAQSQVDRMVEINGRASVDMDGVPFPFTGYPDEQITTRIDVRQYADIKLRAIRCHRSQLSPETPLMQPDFDPLAEENRWFWQETFRLAPGRRGQPVAASENNLFEGVG